MEEKNGCFTLIVCHVDVFSILRDSKIKSFIISMNTDKFAAAFRTYNEDSLSKNEIQYSLKIIIEV